jgi:uridine kinase
VQDGSHPGTLALRLHEGHAVWLPFKDHHTLEDQARLEASELLRRLAPRERDAVLDLFEIAKLGAGDLITEGDGETNGPIIVLEGDVRLARLHRSRFESLSPLIVRRRVPVETAAGLVVGARAAGRTLALYAEAPPKVELEPLTLDDWEGREIYKRSAGLVVLEAAGRAGYKGLRLGPSWSSGRLVVAPNLASVPEEAATAINHHIGALIAEHTPLREEVWSTDDAARYLRERTLDDVADLVAASTEPHVELVSCGDVRLPSPGPVLPDAGMLADIRVFPHPDGLALDFGSAVRRTLAPRPAKTLMLEALAPRYGAEMTKEEQGWRRLLEVSSVGSFNRAVVTGEVAEVIRVSEGFHEKRLGRLADEIRDRGSVRIVAVAGPSSSGKTTFIKRLRIQLEVNGIRPVGLSLDDYYVDREKTVRDATGAYDYEALAALDRELLARHLGALLSGQRVRTARYDFVSGKSDSAGGPELDLHQDKVLVLEGLHGLNPELVPSLEPRTIHRVFIHPASALAFDPLTSFEPADVRLLRRIVRDRHGRGASAETNLARWSSVRRGERLTVFPFQASADSVFDTSLLYEVSVLKVFAERYLLEVPRSSAQFPAALRLRKLIAPFVPIYPDHVPPTSILREFIGGGGFTW